MPDIRCSYCGKENPDFLDVCQFCQNPLKPSSTLRIGQNPTKKDTGELEGVLPDWLKNARKQARDTAEEDAAQVAAQPKVQKEEPPDLLAGLAFQANSADEEEIPDWLSSINPVAAKPATPAAPVQPEPENDFFSQFNTSTPAHVTLPSTPTSEPKQSPSPASETDELSAWLSHAAQQTPEPFAFDQDTSAPDSDWGIRDVPSAGPEPSPAPKEEEDLGWLRNLESAAKQTDQLRAPQPNMDWASDLNASTQGPEQGELDWLNNLGAIDTPEQKVPPPVTPSQPQEDLSWLNNLGGTSSSPSAPSSDDDLSWLNKLGGQPIERPGSQPAKPQEDLSWLNSFSETQATSQPVPASGSQDDLDWLKNLDAPSAEPSTPQPGAQEDLSWLKNFESTPVESSTPQAQPQEDLSWLKNFDASPVEPSAPQSQPQDDMSWLKNFDAAPAEQPATKSETPQDDLSWLNTFSSASSPAESAPASSSNDLDWLNNLGSTPAESAPAKPEASQEDLGWLSALGGTPQSSQPVSSSDDLGWLNSLQGEQDNLSSLPFEQATPTDEDVPPVSRFSPAKTAPLDENSEISVPDWLKSATETPSMPMGMQQLDQFREDFKVPSQPEEPFSWKSFTQEAKPADEPLRSQPEPAAIDPGFFASSSSSSTPSADDVNSLFSIDMPDWLSQETAREDDASQSIGINAEGGESLSPVDLPSWVQAMRPMDAVISEAIPSTADLPTEKEGPLAGFRGVIPTAPVGSARRPKPVSLKLQASDEQQASAAILEQLLAGETSPRSFLSAPVFASQRPLRWVLGALLLLVLSAMLILRTQMFASSAALPAAAQGSTAVIQGIPEGSNVLVVVDYEPALSGEMEAVSGPVLDQIALLRHPRLSFVSTSPNGPALVERLMNNTNINKTAPDGLGYTVGQNYFNLGYLPGAETGVSAFIQSPKTALPSATVGAFSDYSAVMVLTDNADTARTWVEQLQTVKQTDAVLVHQTLLVASSAQAGPLLLPYVSSQQIDGLIAGLADASRFEFVNNSRPGIARSYWDAFSIGLILAVVLMVLGSLWSIIAVLRTRRAEAAEE